MAEFAAFHYLMHKDNGPEIKQHFITDKPKEVPKFLELWPAEGDAAERRLLKKEEKHYWRTGHRIEYQIFEDRKCETIVVLSTDTEKKEQFRPLFLSAHLLYTVLENKKQKIEGFEPPMERKIVQDNELNKATCDYLLSRLQVTGEKGAHEVPLPVFAGGSSH